VKSILRELKIDEISMVDVPANKHCRVAIIKRATAPTVDTARGDMPVDQIEKFLSAEDRLEQLAEEYAEKHNVTKAVGYDKVLGTELGLAAYDDIEDARHGLDRGTVAKHIRDEEREIEKQDEILKYADPARLAEGNLEALAKKLQRHGETYAQAFDRVMTTTSEGRELYEQALEA
jgi:hypothetical protein